MRPRLKLAATRLLAMLLSISLVAVQTPVLAQSGGDETQAEQAELERLLAPVALYPDALLTQVLMASTYPVEVVQAARWVRQNPQLEGEQAVAAVEDRDWDPSVKALVAFPQVLERMDEQLEWTSALGDAFLAHQGQVMDTVQNLRQRARAAGHLASSEQVRVIERERVIVIEPAQPRVVYVPWYDPLVVYGPWWRPAHPPVRWAHWHGRHGHSHAHAGILWGIGIGITVGLLFAAIDWPQRHVKVVHVHHPVYQRRPVVRHAHHAPHVWRHDPVHRRGAHYRHHEVRQRHAAPPAAHAAPRRPGHDARGDERREQRREARPEARHERRSEPPREAGTKRHERYIEAHRESRPEPRHAPRSEKPREAHEPKPSRGAGHSRHDVQRDPPPAQAAQAARGERRNGRRAEPARP